VTAVEVRASNGPTDYQTEYDRFSRDSRRIVPLAAAE
jgi:formate dehydrogenase major subunit